MTPSREQCRADHSPERDVRQAYVLKMYKINFGVTTFGAGPLLAMERLGGAVPNTTPTCSPCSQVITQFRTTLPRGISSSVKRSGRSNGALKLKTAPVADMLVTLQGYCSSPILIMPSWTNPPARRADIAGIP